LPVLYRFCSGDSSVRILEYGDGILALQKKRDRKDDEPEAAAKCPESKKARKQSSAPVKDEKAKEGKGKATEAKPSAYTVLQH
jgi:hypothetical protein